MKDESEEILDQPSLILQTNSIDFDLRMLRGLGLAYFFYGLVYWIQLGEFLVPLPMVYIFIPFSGIIMFLRSINHWIGAFILLLLPVMVLKDLTLNDYPNLSGLLMLATFLVWSIWSWTVGLKSDLKNYTKGLFIGSQNLIWLMWLISSSLVQIIIVIAILIGATIYVRRYLEEATCVHHVRVGLLIQFMMVLYLLQQLSIYWTTYG
ncbi:MAG: hypothetical protein H6599_11350 [Flavobacteriales bacterium]|nr:hypothetical protein [Flavobacteriales bacterium]